MAKSSRRLSSSGATRTERTAQSVASRTRSKSSIPGVRVFDASNKYFVQGVQKPDNAPRSKVPRTLTINKDGGPRAIREYYQKVFMDPPNATELENRVVTADHSIDVKDDRPQVSRFRQLQFNSSCTNREQIFKAVMFLRNRVPELADLDDENAAISLARTGPTFKQLAEELGKAEPSLRGVTAIALHSLYDRIVQERNKLDEFIKMSTGTVWIDTRLSEMASELALVDREIRARNTWQSTSKDKEKRGVIGVERSTYTQRSATTASGRHSTTIQRIQSHDRGRKVREHQDEVEKDEIGTGESIAEEVDAQVREDIDLHASPAYRATNRHSYPPVPSPTHSSSSFEPNDAYPASTYDEENTRVPYNPLYGYAESSIEDDIRNLRRHIDMETYKYDRIESLIDHVKGQVDYLSSPFGPLAAQFHSLHTFLQDNRASIERLHVGLHKIIAQQNEMFGTLSHRISEIERLVAEGSLQP